VAANVYFIYLLLDIYYLVFCSASDYLLELMRIFGTIQIDFQIDFQTFRQLFKFAQVVPTAKYSQQREVNH
jgi:hypothetical protein